MTFADFWEIFRPWIVAGVGGFFGAALLLPTKLGEAVFKYRFDKAVEAFRAEQGQALEKLRAQLAHLGDRGKRSNEMEFAAIQQVWDKVVEAFMATGASVTSLMQHPDLNKMSTDEIEAYLGTTEFSKGQIEQIAQATDHNDMYVKVVIFRQIAEAAFKIFNARLLLRKQRIFMPAAIHDRFQSLIDMLSAAQVERELQHQHPHIPRNSWGKGITTYHAEGNKAYDELAGAVNERLFRTEPD